MLVDYFIIRKGNMHLPDMFSLSKGSRYHYFHGFNMRAFAAFVIGFLLPLPGFAGTFGNKIGIAATHMFTLGWVLSFLMGCLSYYILCVVWKVPGDDSSHSYEEQVGPSQQMILDGVLFGNEHPGREISIDSEEPSKEAQLEEKTV